MLTAGLILYLLSFFTTTLAWDQEELEMFDLVEEVNQNFYDVLGVLQNCSQAEIRKAYRKLSLQLHPDKNDADDAEVKFRQLVGIYEVLRDDAKRAQYDRVLVEGLPNWRQPLYYYRRVRKMGMLELSVWLFVLFTVGQYAVAWGSYFEKKLTLDEVKASKMKKLQKQMKKSKKSNDVDVDEEMEQFVIPKPSYKNTLPFQLVNGIIALPALIRWIIKYRQEKKKEEEERKEQERIEAEELKRELEELEKEKERKALYKRKRALVLPSYDDDRDECVLDAVDEPDSQSAASEGKVTTRVSGGLWTDDDLTELAKYMKKFPTGTTERWEKIADALNRTVGEVTHFAKKMRENAFRPPEGQEGENTSTEEQRVERKKEKTRGGKNNILLAEPTQSDYGVATEEVPGSTGWSQKQQKALETALATYTKGSLERWERIAKAVPGKTKEECMVRVKYLSELVKKKKQIGEERLKEQQGDKQTDDEPNKEISETLDNNEVGSNEC
nr:EOG090X0BHG [Ilyocryptus agilis]